MFNDYLSIENIILRFCASEIGLKSISVVQQVGHAKTNKITDNFKKELSNYFIGSIKKFESPLDIDGTDFQKLVWGKLRDIPYGKTNSYKEVALKVGGGNYSRAVGMANNKNPLPIIIPCHRVIGSDGDLVGYALGLNLKKKLLELESKQGVTSELPFR
jgi:O-6-methylguanine DNA methyltransferase